MPNEKSKSRKLTTGSGIPYVEHEDTMSAGARGPLLLQDFILHESLAHFNRERIPERVLHANGSGAFGTLTITHDISKYTRAKLFNKTGKQTKIFIRFSTVGGERGSADTERDPRGFAMKFYTEDGNWDLVGNNTPVFFIKDAKKFPDFIHTQKRDPRTNCKSANAVWDFFSLNPETLHQLLILFSDRGIPYGYRHMDGFGSHTFSLINAANEMVYVKFHFICNQGIKNFSAEEAEIMKGKDPDFSQRDLLNAIDHKDFPSWSMKIQVMPLEQSRQVACNPFDVSKVWSHADFPLIDVAQMELNQNAENYFRDVEQAAFAPAHVVDGISYSPDKMLQGRIFAYPDASRYRLGVNYEQIPVNRCPYKVANYQRDGFMRTDENGGGDPNYYPNSYDDIYADKSYQKIPVELESQVAAIYDRNAPREDDHYSQPNALFSRIMNDEKRAILIDNIVNAMKGIEGPKKDEIINRQLCNFFRVNEQLGAGVAKGLGVNLTVDAHNGTSSNCGEEILTR